MIYTDFSDLFRYFGISENLDTALSFLQKCDLKTLVHGRNEVDGEKVYINRFDYETLPFAETFFEPMRSMPIFICFYPGRRISAYRSRAFSEKQDGIRRRILSVTREK